jgi:3-oxoacyl-[acyl-carrier protein] reductase
VFSQRRSTAVNATFRGPGRAADWLSNFMENTPMTEGRLAGKVALVTGAGRGIGPEIAKRLASEGAIIIAHYAQSKDGAINTVAAIEAMGGQAIAYQADIGERSEVVRLFEDIDRNPGRIDIVVNTAGVGSSGKLAALDDDDMAMIFGVNLYGPLYVASEAAKRLQEGGRIINFGSTAQEFPSAGSGLYAAAKAALKSCTTSWARELGTRGITVNMVIPGATSPGMIDNWPQNLSVYEAASPFKRIGRADEIAALVAFLASPEGSWVSGAHIIANGAATA